MKESTDLTSTLVLIQRSQAGDDEALNTIFTRYYDRVLMIVRLRTGATVRTFMESRDVAQEALLKALERIDEFEVREEAGLINWLAKIVENRIRDLAKYAKADLRNPERAVSMEQLSPPTDKGSGVYEPPAEEPQPPEQATSHERRALVLAGIDQLPMHYREVIALRDFAGGSWNFIAGETETTVGAARMTYSRALARLAEALPKDIDP